MRLSGNVLVLLECNQHFGVFTNFGKIADMKFREDR